LRHARVERSRFTPPAALLARRSVPIATPACGSLLAIRAEMEARRTRASVALLASLAAAISACQGQPPLFLRGCLEIPDRTTCSLDGVDPATAPVQTSATIDAEYAGQYMCTAAVVATGLSSPAVLTQAEIQVLDVFQDYALVREFSYPLTAPLQPDASGSAAATTTAVILDPGTLAGAAAEVADTGNAQVFVARFAVEGRLVDGTPLLSSWVDYPITVFAGGTCIDTAGLLCIDPPSQDCRLGIDEETSCQSVASRLGICRTLECDLDDAGKSIASTAHCPAHVPPEDSCCNP
jgi:hypothetical protein